jgi:tRNA A-37 threonylcarbamoyl transferase component Bud32
VPTPSSLPQPPSADDLAAYRAGRLDLARFEAVDAWIAAQSPDEQARLLSDESVTQEMAAIDLPSSAHAPAFVPDAGGAPRYRITGRLGAGGMGVVELARDQVLGREVALKRCRARRVDESVASHAARLRAFRREAAITAQLEHPGIVPVHDVGLSFLGEPAFVMKRLDGDSLEALLDRWQTSGQRPDLARVAELMLRVAEAIAYAHRRGVVHRDLKPGNIIVGALGAVHVIDWGLAGMVNDGTAPTKPAGSLLIGSSDSNTTQGTFRLGTPAWMAPEQSGAVPPDPRMDVFALGGLLMALLTLRGPRPTGASGAKMDLSPLDTRGLPRGLVAVARRCLAMTPAERYDDGEAVAAELRRWLGAGLTQAEHAGPVVRFLMVLRRSPRLIATGIGVLVTIAVTFAVLHLQAAQERERLATELTDLARTVDLGDEQAVRATRVRVDTVLRSHPDLPEGLSLNERLRAIEDSFTAQQLLERHRSLLRLLHRRYRMSGPWPGEIEDLSQGLAVVGYNLTGDPHRLAQRLKSDRLCTDVLLTIAQLQRALLVCDARDPLRTSLPTVIREAAPNPAWLAIGELLAHATLQGHDLRFGSGPATDAVLTEADTTDFVLSCFAAEPRLVRAAWERWHEDTAAFWPRIMAGRDCVDRGDWRLAERHALVALGAEPDSLWPHLILAYVALADGDWENLMREADAARVENPDHLEVMVLAAVGMARSGRLAQAQALIDDCGRAELLQYHLANNGHPMHRGVKALVEAGVMVANVPPKSGPLVPRNAAL